MPVITFDTACAEPALRSETIPPAFLSDILAPYQPTGTDYLKEARVVRRQSLDPDVDLAHQQGVPIITTEGRYSIPTSCYIQSTGHFNAVEFLICYNQLAYATFGHLIAERLLGSLPEGRVSAACLVQWQRLSIDLFLQKQLSSMFILKASTRFKRIIDANDFRCVLAVDSIFYRHGTFFTDTSCRFVDDHGGGADGSVMLAYPVSRS